MYTTQWTYLTNPFLIASESNYQIAMAISTFHDAVLSTKQNDPYFGPMYAAYHPIHLAFKAAYDSYDAQGHVQTGQTLNFTLLIKLLSSKKAKAFDIAIQNIYAQDTTEYQTLMPYRRKPFQLGTQAEKMQAVETLNNALAGYPALAAVKNNVDTFYQALDLAFTSKNANKSTTHQFSAEVEAQRKIMGTAQYANLGALIEKFAATPDSLSIYFDLESIRRSSQVKFTGHLKPLARHTVFQHTFAAADEMLLKNQGNSIIQVYLAQTKNAAAVTGTVIITLAPNTIQTIAASALGDFANNHFLIVSNPDALVIGAWVVDLE